VSETRPPFDTSAQCHDYRHLRISRIDSLRSVLVVVLRNQCRTVSKRNTVGGVPAFMVSSSECVAALRHIESCMLDRCWTDTIDCVSKERNTVDVWGYITYNIHIMYPLRGAYLVMFDRNSDAIHLSHLAHLELTHRPIAFAREVALKEL
jgi:hypothetical protein